MQDYEYLIIFHFTQGKGNGQFYLLPQIKINIINPSDGGQVCILQSILNKIGGYMGERKKTQRYVME